MAASSLAQRPIIVHTTSHPKITHVVTFIHMLLYGNMKTSVTYGRALQHDLQLGQKWEKLIEQFRVIGEAYEHLSAVGSKGMFPL